MALRYTSFFLIAFLLLSPIVKTLQKIVQNPVIIVAWDNSASMKANPDSLLVEKNISELRSKLRNNLSSKFTIAEYSFGEETKPFKKLSYDARESDYSQLFSTIAVNHFNENVGAMILVGDGIYNQGKNPVNMLSETGFPVYTVAFGDTTEVVDARIQEIRVNRTSFSGNKFPVEIDVRYSKLKGKPMKLSVNQNNTEVAGTIINPASQNYFFTSEFILDAGTAGLKHFTVKTEIIGNERNTLNNEAKFVINVLEKKQKILILSDGPHPDIGAIKNTLDEQTTYDVDVFNDEPYPASLGDYNLIIINQLPTSGKSASEIVTAAGKNRIPLLFIVGNKTFIPQLNALLQGVVIKMLAGTGEEAQPMLNQAYASYNLSEDLKELIPRFPPLQVSFADYELDPSLTPLLNQRILNIPTGKPLIATATFNNRKTGFIFGEGIWRWRLFNYSANQNHALFNEFVNQLIQFLALRQNDDNFIIGFKPVYTETDEIIMNAEVYNDAFERITTSDVKITFKNSSNQELNYTFDKRGQDYSLNAGYLPVGDYSFSANVDIAGKQFNETGNFTITRVNLENTDLRANHQLLYQLAEISGGKFYNTVNTGELIDELNKSNQLKPTSYYQEMVNELLNLKWIFGLILLFLSMEWFLRKYWGIY